MSTIHRPSTGLYTNRMARGSSPGLSVLPGHRRDPGDDTPPVAPAVIGRVTTAPGKVDRPMPGELDDTGDPRRPHCSTCGRRVDAVPCAHQPGAGTFLAVPIPKGEGR